jgi:putative intracellular protease/amidase
MKDLRVVALLLLVLILVGSVFSQAQTPDTSPKLKVAIFIFPGVQTIDYSGPMEVFAQAQTNVYAVAEKPDPVVTASGLTIIPKYTFNDAPKADLIVLPGGGGYKKGHGGVGDQLDNPVVIQWIQDNSRQAKVLTVCNGAFFAAKAGLLNGLPATTFYGMLPNLTEVSPTTIPVYDKRYVDNGNIVTTAGLSSGIDGSLYVVSKMLGMGTAKGIALNMEYNWDPNSTYARASLGDMNIPNSLGSILPPFKSISSTGGTDNWTDVNELSTNLSAEEMLKRTNDNLSASGKWTKVDGPQASAPTSYWKITDHAGKLWKGVVTVSSDATKKDTLILTFQLNRI